MGAYMTEAKRNGKYRWMHQQQREFMENDISKVGGII
jgi:hypothetical protein